MRAFFIFFCFFLVMLSGDCFAVDIAQCSNPSGKGYYPYLGLMGKKEAGWTEEKITGGLTTLTRQDDGDYNILFVDATKQINSARQDGAKIVLLSHGKNDASFLVIYPLKTVEIYTFLNDLSGKAEYTIVTNKPSEGALFAKASVMRGDCKFVRPELIN